MADQTVLEQSLESQIVDEPFVSRQSVYVIDSNNGAYNGQIQIDTSSLSNSGRWASYSEGVLQIPLVVTLEALAETAAATTNIAQTLSAQTNGFKNLAKQFAVGLKNGHFQLIHSLSVEYNNTSVVQLTPYLNHYVSYKLLTTLSEDDVEKWGAMLGFFPDSPQSHDYDDATAAGAANSWHGHGSTNNKNMPTFKAAFSTPLSDYKLKDVFYNEGFHKRSVKSFGLKQSKATTTPLVTDANSSVSLGANVYQSALQNGSFVDTFFVLAQIRLKDVCDFFDKLPLTRGAYMRLLINTNTAEHKIGYTLSKLITAPTDAANCVQVQDLNCLSTTVTGGSSPLLVASGMGPQSQSPNFTTVPGIQGGAFCSADTGTGLTTVSSSTNYQFNFRARCSIVKDTTLNITHPTFQNCRLYVPLYTMTNEEVKRYLTLQPTKHIVYRDIFQYQIEVGAGGTFNNLLTNGVANPKALIVIPYIATSANKVNKDGLTTAVYQSPFASEPGTTSPYIGITDYNVQLAGVNIYTSNTQYDFEAFRNELARINGINGGVVDGLMSGLVGLDNFQTNMRYYVTDLSRRIKAEDAVPKSIQISGRSTATVPITLFVFVEFEKSTDIALDSGLLLG